ncbi:MAG: alpha/beta hydrolase [Phycisphaerales bacterium]|jgi:non-heme chloroperoxidase|nr:alpha/beta hydrolase [Phycisphaerales bacterium]
MQHPNDTVTTKDGVCIYFKDWGNRDGQPIVFSHGWPLSADDWDPQMMYFASRGFRCIAHDRRGHGRSSQTWDGNDMDHYADDLLALVEHLDLKGAIHVGHSTGGGEVACYIGRHGAGRAKGRVAKAVLIGAVPPIMVKSPNNVDGLPRENFDGLRAALLADRAQLFREVPAGPFYGFNRPGAKVSQGLIDNWWRQGMMAGVKAAHDCIKAFSETDFTEDLRKFTIPTLIMHGDDDQIVPIAGSALLSAKLIPGATLKVYKGFDHGLCATHHAEVNPDLLQFIRG